MKSFRKEDDQCLYNDKGIIICTTPDCEIHSDASTSPHEHDLIGEYVYQSRKVYNFEHRNVSREILNDLEMKRSIIKNLLVKRQYREVLRILNDCCFRFMMPKSDLDETRFTPYNTELIDKYNLNSYINASEITLGEKKYIASQIPCVRNLDVFVNLLKNSNTKTIVSLVSNTEHLKSFDCLSSEEKVYKDNILFYDEVYNLRGHIVRIFRFDNWIDHSIISLKELEFFYNYIGRFENYPILVHCRAGIGRTGFFIVYDYLRQKDKVSLDEFLDILFILRSRRSGTVWSIEQLSYLIYLFVK